MSATGLRSISPAPAGTHPIQPTRAKTAPPAAFDAWTHAEFAPAWVKFTIEVAKLRRLEPG